MEIEKKYLTKALPFDIEQYPKKEISQSYISLSPTIRIRRLGDKYFLTVKGRGSVCRQEFELEISKYEYDGLLKKRCTGELLKTRYFIPIEKGLTAEVDIYHGSLKGLITTEVEFKSVEEMESFVPPQWFGKDISLDNRYKNTWLIENGIPQE